MAPHAGRPSISRRSDQEACRYRAGRSKRWLAAAVIAGGLAGPALAGSHGGKLIDPSAEPSTPSTPVELLAARMRAYGARCDTVDAIKQNGAHDFTVICDSNRRNHRIFDAGDRWVIETRE